jgi:PleD family two-component response regulator
MASTFNRRDDNVTQPPDRRQHAANETGEPLRILIVDDDINYRTYVAALMRRLGFWVDTADDGQACLDRVVHGTYDMAIIDHDMPRLNGIDGVAPPCAWLHEDVVHGHADQS